MIRTQTATRVIIQCDRCAHTFGGEMGEVVQRVAYCARLRGWSVSRVDGRAECATCRSGEARSAPTPKA